MGLRRCNPHVHSDGWLRRGKWPADRMATYKFSNRFTQADHQPLFSRLQETEAYDSNQLLGSTFGLTPPKPNCHRPGDRYLHTQCRGKASRVDPSTVDVAGQPSESPLLDQGRWLTHNTIGIGNGNQRTAY